MACRSHCDCCNPQADCNNYSPQGNGFNLLLILLMLILVFLMRNQLVSDRQETFQPKPTTTKLIE
jgi:hypothetical protein